SVYFAYDRLGNVEKVRDAVGDRTFYYTDESEPGTDGRLHKESIVSSNYTYVIKYDYDSAKRRLDKLMHGLYSPTLTMDFGYETGANRKGALTSIVATG